MASTEDLFTSPADSAEPSDAQAPAAPAKRTRRATKKAATPAPAAEPSAQPGADSISEAAAEPSTESATEQATEPANEGAAPAKKAAKRSPRKATSKRAKAAPVDSDSPAADPGAATATATAPDQTSAEDEASDQSAGAPAAPSFGVLFQAPDVTAAPARRTRKASAPATTPTSAPKQDDAAQAEAEEQSGPQSQPEADSTGPDSDDSAEGGRRRRRRGGKGRGRGRGAEDNAQQPEESQQGAQSAAGTGADTEQAPGSAASDSGPEGDGQSENGEGDTPSSRRRRRRRRSGSGAAEGEDSPGTVTRVRESRRDEPQSVKGSTRLEAKKQRRREGREAGRRRTVITEAEFLARRESVERVMVVRERAGKTQIAVLEDGVLVEHYVSRETNASMAGNVYLGRVQNVLPSMEAAFVDIGKGRNAVLYAGEVNWDAAGLENNQPKRIENALKSGDSVLVQVTKDPIGHKGARLTSQVSLPGRYLVYVPEGSMTGISRKLPDTERSRLKGILKEVLPDSAGVIVRTAAEGASEEELRADVQRLTSTWEKIKAKAESKAKAKGGAPVLVHGEPDLTVRVIRDVFNEDFGKLVVAGEQAYAEVSEYLHDVAPDLAGRLEKWTANEDLFTHHRVDEQIAKAMDRKVWLPSGGSLVIDRTEAMTVVDVNTGKFVGSGGNLEETVTKNNIEAAEEIVRQLRLRDIGGIIVIDFIDMVLESNRDLVVRRLLECLGRDRTKHQVAEVTSLGLVQMTRKRVGSGLIEVFSETCEHCNGRGIIVHADPVERSSNGSDGGHGGGHGSSGGSGSGRSGRSRRQRDSGAGSSAGTAQAEAVVHSGPTPAQIAAAAHAAAVKSAGDHPDDHADLAGDDEVSHADLAAHADTTEPGQVDAPASEQVDTAPTQPAPVAQAAPPAPRRRKRARVVAPAGPPRHAADDADGAPAAGEQPASVPDAS